MMMMTTGRIPVRRDVEGVVMAITMTMTTARVRRRPRAVRQRLGRGREQRMGRGKGRRLRTGRGKGRARGRGRGTVKRKVLFHTPHEEMISLVLLLCSCRRNCQRQTWIWRDN
jgi:hypothetical protein